MIWKYLRNPAENVMQKYIRFFSINQSKININFKGVLEFYEKIVTLEGLVICYYAMIGEISIYSKNINKKCFHFTEWRVQLFNTLCNVKGIEFYVLYIVLWF